MGRKNNRIAGGWWDVMHWVLDPQADSVVLCAACGVPVWYWERSPTADRVVLNVSPLGVASLATE
jgi:hypothetical protein